MLSVTTVFRPDPTCFAPSNLWLTIRTGWGCDTYYPPFAPRPTEILPPLACTYVELGRPGDGNYDDLCHQYNWVTTGATIYDSTAYSACPEGMTGARTLTRETRGIIFVTTNCCPTAYDFVPANLVPTPIPSVIDGTTYPVTYSTSNVLCKAASVEKLSGKKVTMTVRSGNQIADTTVVDWDYENDFIIMTAPTIYKNLFPDPRAGTTSTCFGDQPGCDDRTNPYIPRPTYAPPNSYVPPPSPAVTQFTPPPSCLSDSNLWLVSGKCSVTDPGKSSEPLSPPWLQCTHTVAGDPNESEPACYQGGPSTVIDGKPTWYTACPVGHTVFNSSIYKPFDRSTRTYNVDATLLTCCPTAFRDIAFTYTTELNYVMSPTVHDGVTRMVIRDPLPRCFASRVGDRLAGMAVTMGLYSDAGGWDSSAKKPGQKYEGTSREAVWDEARDTLFAHPAYIMYTVFHGTHTCFENCNEYLTYSYHNTQRGSKGATTTTAAAGGGGDGSPRSTLASSAGAAAAMARGDMQAAGLSVVVVVVTIVHVAIGGFV
ncbi:hypothetical protein P885DRAFT_41222 [Corynascus similis CBS 632.67]